MELEVNVVKLENDIDYIIVEAIKNEENKYLFLANAEDEEDICIRKVYEKDGQEYLEKLDSDEEFEEVLNLFNAKYNKERILNEE